MPKRKGKRKRRYKRVLVSVKLDQKVLDALAIRVNKTPESDRSKEIRKILGKELF